MAKPRKESETTRTERIIEATGIDERADGESGYDFIYRVCDAITELDDAAYKSLDNDLKDWFTAAVENLGAKGNLEDIPLLDGVSATDGAPGDDDAADEEVVDEETDTEEEVAEEETDPEPEPQPVRRVGKRTAPAAEEATVDAPKRARGRPRKEAADPAKTVVKPAKAAATDGEPKRGPGRPRKEAAAAAPVVAAKSDRPRVVKKATGASGNGHAAGTKVVRKRGEGGTYQFAEMVVLDPDAAFDEIKKRAEKKNIEIKESQMRNSHRVTQNVMNIVKRHYKLAPL